MLIYLIVFPFWFALGLWGFEYWWTTQFTRGSLPPIRFLIAALIGPFTWIIGWFIHSKTWR